MRILYHHRTQAEDAQGIHIHEMVEAFRQLGHEVRTTALVERDGADGRKTRGARWRWLMQAAPSWLYECLGLAYNGYGFIRLAAAITRYRPDLIYERYALNTVCGIWASRAFGIPLVLEVNAPLAREQAELGRLTFRRLAAGSERWVCSRSTRTIAVSGVLKELLVDLGVPDARVVVVPNGVDARRFHPDVCGDEVRKRYGLNDYSVLGFIGWFRPWHGLDMLLDAVHETARARRPIRLLLVGDGPACAELRRHADALGLTDTAIFTGPIPRGEVPAHIAAMDIAVQPSAPRYACPMKILEYMAMGKCIVAPNQPNIRELLQDGVTARLFQPGDPRDLAAVIESLLEAPGRRLSVGRKAHEAVHVRRHLWSANALRALDAASDRRAA